MLRHLWHHAAEDFAAKGLRGIQAVDFLDRARSDGPLSADLHADDAHAAAPLLYAADGLERLFPGTFDAASLARLAARVPPCSPRAGLDAPRPPPHAPAARLHADGPVARAGPARRRSGSSSGTPFPTLGEVKANVAPGAEGIALRVAWLPVLARRASSLIR